MEISRIKALALTILTGLFSVVSLAGHAGSDYATVGMTNLQKALCERAVNSGDHEAVEVACVSNTNIAWYQDRDNSMSDANDEVGQNMVVIMSKNNQTIGTQVYCPLNPGTVLGTAHGTVDNPATAVEQGRDYRTSANNLWGVASFPFSAKRYFTVSTDEQVVSPRTDPDADRGGHATDYAFIIPDEVINPQLEGIRILNASSAELVATTENNGLSVNLYRARTIYHKNPDGTPDFTRPPPRNPDLNPIYDIPQRVNQSCQIQSSQTRELTKTDCPLEQGVSGSPLISEINGEIFMVGIATRAISDSFISFGPMSAGGSFLNSAQFCSDYQKVCGVPCSDINEVLQ